ncbi:MAG: tetratricopeptide repeat protein [Sulfuricella sp.]|nr:tetratricopeptide repeat protein [Sulfuricella sp.]
MTASASPNPPLDDAEIRDLVALFHAGRHAELESRVRLLLERQPDSGLAWKVLGVALQAQGKEALPALQKAAHLLPDDTEAHANLARALNALGHGAAAQESWRRAVAINLGLARSHNDQGIALHGAGRLDAALASYRQALELYPAYAEAHNNLGNLLKDLGQADEALASYRRALEIHPAYPEVHHNLGVALHDLGRFDEALASYRRALELNPAYPEAHNDLGMALHELRRLDEALASYRRAVAIQPDFAEAHSNLGNALRDLGQLDGALDSYRRALAIRGDFPEALANQGIALHELGRFDEALASYRRALEINPDFAEAHFNRAVCLLKTRRYPEGWLEYEYRWTGVRPQRLRPSSALPQWRGEQPAPGQRLLVFEEQGLGDRIQFARYLPLAAQRFSGGISIVVAAPLRELLRRSFPGVEFLDAIPADQSAWHWQCPLLSLPLACATTLENLPNRVPYLIPDPAQVAAWRARIAALGLPAATRKIGVVWKSGNAMKNAPLRSLALRQLAPLLEVGGCAWFSLQLEADPDAAPWRASARLIDWAGEFADFDATAALAANLDLIVAVDTAVAHLGGALGVPTWLFNRHAGEWRWLHERDDSPWYPTLRIFTQRQPGNWAEVVMRMAAELAGPA